MQKEIAIQVENVSKTFLIPKEKISTLRGAFVNVWRKKSFEKFSALKNVSFEVKKGEFFGIIGRNGSGKSTLLKILAGIYTPDQGKVKINGRISPFLELGIGFNPELSGRDNIFLNASVLGLTRKQIEEKFDDIVAFSELRRFIDQKVKNYSSGMQVRLAFSVAIHANREILLMDEVLAVGDANFQGKCMEEFNKYKEQGKTVVLVTHDIATIQKYCDRAMLLRNGKIQMIGDPEKVGNKYIYQNMSDEEKRIFDEEKRLRLKAEKELQKRQEEELRLQKEMSEREKKELEEQRAKERKEREEAEKKAREERKNKIAQITKVEFLDKDGKVRNVFKTGDYLDIKIDFKVFKETKKLNFGIGLHALSGGGQVFGYNTQMDKYEVKKHNNSIILHFDSMPLLKGEYLMNVACWGDSEQNHYDYKPGCKTLKMCSTGLKNSYRGFCDIKHDWKS